MWITRVNLPGSLDPRLSKKFCFEHGSDAGVDGGVQLAPNRWICFACWRRRKAKQSLRHAKK